MKITNVRLGFANNSSSSHSILLFPKGHIFKDKKIYNEGDGVLEGSYYGWEEFILASEHEKAKYFASQLAGCLRPQVGVEITRQVIVSLFGVDPSLVNSSVDHQSKFTIPRYSDGSFPLDFCQELFGYFIKNKNIVVFGGNDNDGSDREFTSTPESFEILKEIADSPNKLNIRKESYGWTLFNPVTGAKLRFQSEDWKKSDQKPLNPELVDVKITSACNNFRNLSCSSFCYQGSDYKGKHADTKEIKWLLDEFKKMQVFEVVFGGGEPTQHPDFAHILQYAREKCNVVPNFTTKNVSLFAQGKHEKNNSVIEAIKKYTGSFAFSVVNADEAKEALNVVHALGDDIFDKMVLQIIIGVVSPEEIKKIKEVADIFNFNKFSYVGWKSCGKARNPLVTFDKYNMPENILSDDWCGRVYVDTSLLNLFPELNQKYTCDSLEGVYSMYVDLVEDTLSESSYTGEKIKIPDEQTFWKNYSSGKHPNSLFDFIQIHFSKFGKDICDHDGKEGSKKDSKKRSKK